MWPLPRRSSASCGILFRPIETPDPPNARRAAQELREAGENARQALYDQAIILQELRETLARYEDIAHLS